MIYYHGLIQLQDWPAGEASISCGTKELFRKMLPIGAISMLISALRAGPHVKDIDALFHIQ